MTNSNITIETVNGIEFKTNKSSSNYYIKEIGGKFIRVKVAEFTDRKELEIRNGNPEDYSHFILVDIAKTARIEDCESYELSIRRKQYNRNHVYLSESISRKFGVLFTLTTKRVNGHRLYHFFGPLENIEAVIIEINSIYSGIRKTTNIDNEIRKMILTEINKNRKIYQNIDIITKAFIKNRKTVTISM
jgi:hypothetical protein